MWWGRRGVGLLGVGGVGSARVRLADETMEAPDVIKERAPEAL